MKKGAIVRLLKGEDHLRAVLWRVTEADHLLTLEPLQPYQIPLFYGAVGMWGDFSIESADPIKAWPRNVEVVNAELDPAALASRGDQEARAELSRGQAQGQPAGTGQGVRRDGLAYPLDGQVQAPHPDVAAVEAYFRERCRALIESGRVGGMEVWEEPDPGMYCTAGGLGEGMSWRTFMDDKDEEEE